MQNRAGAGPSMVPQQPGVEEETYIMRTEEEVRKYMDESRVFKGQKTTVQVAEEDSFRSFHSEDINQNKIQVDREFFRDYQFIDETNAEQFEYLASGVILKFLEADISNTKALEFPNVIHSEGRTIVQKIANFLGLASHSQGQSKARKVLVYRRTLFLDKQEREQIDRDKEKEKQVERSKKNGFFDPGSSEPLTHRDAMLRDIWNEFKGIQAPPIQVIWQGPIEERIVLVRRKMVAFQDNLRKISA